MPEVTIRYKKPETLKILKSLAKYFDFTVSKEKEKEKNASINGITIIPRDDNANLHELRDVITSSNMNAAELRKKAWERKRQFAILM